MSIPVTSHDTVEAGNICLVEKLITVVIVDLNVTTTIIVFRSNGTLPSVTECVRSRLLVLMRILRKQPTLTCILKVKYYAVKYTIYNKMNSSGNILMFS